jgi:hypothetical protein
MQLDLRRAVSDCEIMVAADGCDAVCLTHYRKPHASRR